MKQTKLFGKEIKGQYDRYLKQSQQYKPKTPKTTNFSLEDLTDSYKLTGVQYRNGICQVDVSKTLLPEATQDQHAENRIQALKNKDFYTPDFPLFHSIINTLHKNKDSQSKEQIEQARIFLKDLIEGKWLTTLTRITYQKGKDTVTHNYKQKDNYEIKTNFTGPDGWIKESQTNAQEAIQVLLDTKQTMNEINQIYNWFREKDGYIWRVNKTPESPDKRVAWFFANSDGSYFSCYWIPLGSGSSLGVRASKIK